ncbi:hypothetical protein [Pseudomonas citronellolis]|uniref:hypothetical protein n=1 Tax=Pseudomonas citronellolis TaxID=53408 RepID=UPI00248EC464|nr:hypothetical protein [Pseudomonas citronellolis]
MNRIPQALLDDLRNATEYHNYVQQCPPVAALKDDKTASEWLRTAALNLGEALIAARSAGEVPHA